MIQNVDDRVAAIHPRDAHTRCPIRIDGELLTIP